LRHIELLKKSKETIVKRPNKVMGHATGLKEFVFDAFSYFEPMNRT